MKNCELCKLPARTYCEADQASLCWGCDAKVHGANFLVARHSRTLLCHACHSLTPWKASGPKLGNTVSVCESCAGGMKVMGEEVAESEGGNDDGIDTEDDLDLDDDDDDDIMIGDDDDEDEDEDEVGGDEDGDNQVVPWSSTPPPPAANSCSSEESFSRCHSSNKDISETVTTISLKRRRQDASDQDGPKRLCSQWRYGAELRKQVAWLAYEGGEGTSMELPRPSKDAESGSHSASSEESLNTLNGSQSSSDGKTPETV